MNGPMFSALHMTGWRLLSIFTHDLRSVTLCHLWGRHYGPKVLHAHRSLISPTFLPIHRCAFWFNFKYVFVSLCKYSSVVARKDTPSCSQHASFSPFLVDSPKLKNVYLLRDWLDRTDDFDAFELLGQHIRKETTDGSSPHTNLVRSVPTANLLQLGHVESPFNRTNREEEGGNLTETQL